MPNTTMNCPIEVRSDRTNQIAITTNAARKRNPDTPVINVGNMSECFVANQRKRKADATSITRTKLPLTMIAAVRSSNHNFMARNPHNVRMANSAMLWTMYLLHSLLIFITPQF